MSFKERDSHVSTIHRTLDALAEAQRERDEWKQRHATVTESRDFAEAKRCKALNERDQARAELDERRRQFCSFCWEHLPQFVTAQPCVNCSTQTELGETEAKLREARALLLDVASAGIEHHTTSYVVIQLPLVVWDALETLAQEQP
jgi:hypothetical protein